MNVNEFLNTSCCYNWHDVVNIATRARDRIESEYKKHSRDLEYAMGSNDATKIANLTNKVEEKALVLLVMNMFVDDFTDNQKESDDEGENT